MIIKMMIKIQSQHFTTSYQSLKSTVIFFQIKEEELRNQKVFMLDLLNELISSKLNFLKLFQDEDTLSDIEQCIKLTKELSTKFYKN